MVNLRNPKSFTKTKTKTLLLKNNQRKLINMADRGIGLDLGTSKISVCINNGGRIDKLQLASLNKEYPCCIYYNNIKLYGEEARIKGHSDPKYCFKHLKTLIGRLFSDEYVQSIKDHMPFHIVKGENDRLMVEVRENDQSVLKDPTELLSMLVNYVIEVAQKHMGNKKIEYLALAFPPSFNDSQKMELKRIGIRTGIRHISLYPETTAACIYYGITSMAPGQTVMVVDCGAGTCDATILKYDNGFEVVGHAGKDTIGGDNYTQNLMTYVLKQYELNCSPMKKMSTKKKGKLEDAVEDGKIALKSSSIVEIDIDAKEFSQSVLITQSKLKLLSIELNKEIVAMVKGLIESTKCKPDSIVLSGKGMLLASLEEAICKEVGLNNMKMNIDEPVAHGLAMYLDEIVKKHKENDHCNEIRMFDVVNIDINDLNASFPPIPEFPGPSMADQTPVPDSFLTTEHEVPVKVEPSLPTMPLPSGVNIPGEENSIHQSVTIPEDVPTGSNPVDSSVNAMSKPAVSGEDSSLSGLPFDMPHTLYDTLPYTDIMPPVENPVENPMENPVENPVETPVETPVEPAQMINSHDDVNSGVKESEEEEEMDPGVAHILNTPNKEFDDLINSINPDDIPDVDIGFINQTISSISPNNPVPGVLKGFRITEKRAHDLSIRIVPKGNTDRKLLLSRKDPLPFHNTVVLSAVKGKVFQFSLYEGNNLKQKDNKRIRHTILERDEQHPENNNHKFEISVDVDETGFIQTSFHWVDTKKPIRVIEDKELNKHSEIGISGFMNAKPNNLSESFPEIPNPSQFNTPDRESSHQQPFSIHEDVPLPVADAEIHKPVIIEQPVQQNGQGFTDVDACKVAIRIVIKRMKGELKKMKPKDKEEIEDSIRDIETLLPIQDSLEALNGMYICLKEAEKKAKSTINACTITREMELEYCVCYKGHLEMFIM